MGTESIYIYIYIYIQTEVTNNWAHRQFLSYRCLDPENAEIYKFLGYEQSDALKKSVTLGRVKQEMISWLNRVW